VFNIVLKKAVREIEINIYNTLYQHLAFADVIMIARNPAAIRDAFGKFKTTAKKTKPENK
jgi:hypothetical protein